MKLPEKIYTINPGQVIPKDDMVGWWTYTLVINGAVITMLDEGYSSAATAKRAMRDEIQRLSRVLSL